MKTEWFQTQLIKAPFFKLIDQSAWRKGVREKAKEKDK